MKNSARLSGPIKKYFASTVVALASLVFLPACSKEPQPSKSEIERALSQHIHLPEIEKVLSAHKVSPFLRLSNFSVEAMQNMGTKVDPEWRARFHARLEVTSDTFDEDGQASADDVVFVRPMKRKGDTIEVFGKSTSRLQAGMWRTSIELDESGALGGGVLEGNKFFKTVGVPREVFGPKRIIIRGSKGESGAHPFDSFLIGEWKGTELNGQIRSMVFNADGTCVINGERNLTWHTDPGVSINRSPGTEWRSTRVHIYMNSGSTETNYVIVIHTFANKEETFAIDRGHTELRMEAPAYCMLSKE
jgi:hypothetical protein